MSSAKWSRIWILEFVASFGVEQSCQSEKMREYAGELYTHMQLVIHSQFEETYT